jgi:hypothetical protein
LAYLKATPIYCRKKAQEIGPQTEALIQKILSDHAVRNLRKAQAILRLAERYGQTSMEAAAKRALFFGNFHYRSLRTFLEKGWLTLEPHPLEKGRGLPCPPFRQRFLRSPDYFAQRREEVIS